MPTDTTKVWRPSQPRGDRFLYLTTSIWSSASTVSFGWSANDLLTLSQIIYSVGNFFHNAPENVRVLFDRFDSVGDQLKDLAFVLRNSRLNADQIESLLWDSGLWNYKEAATLERDVNEAKALLEKYKPLSTRQAGFWQRIRNTGEFALEQSTIARYEKSMDIHSQRMSALRERMIL